LKIDKVAKQLVGSDITVSSIESHSKASEAYIHVTFRDPADGYSWSGLIPYYYRRTGLFIESEEDIAAYLKKLTPYFKRAAIKNWIKNEKKLWKRDHHGKDVTKLFFEELSKLKWTSNFPNNDNPQRRIQDIKEMGYTISSRRIGKKMERLLIPIPRELQTGYEVVSSSLKSKVMLVLDHINVFELSSGNISGLIPDHKFPEIRWDAETRTSNSDDLSESEIKKKFQLLDNQRNQQKREICRKCFQTGKRGRVFGINFFYDGGENWPPRIPKVGKDAEKGCIGCGWYDLEKWRQNLTNHLVSRIIFLK
jgi:hypothetical protein